MRYDQLFLASAAALMLLTCTSCSVEQLDADGDGWITKSELLSAAASAVCNDQGAPTDEPPTDEPPSEEPPTDEPPTDETPTDEVPIDDPSADGAINDGTLDEEDPAAQF